MFHHGQPAATADDAASAADGGLSLASAPDNTGTQDDDAARYDAETTATKPLRLSVGGRIPHTPTPDLVFCPLSPPLLAPTSCLHYSTAVDRPGRRLVPPYRYPLSSHPLSLLKSRLVISGDRFHQPFFFTAHRSVHPHHHRPAQPLHH